MSRRSQDVQGEKKKGLVQNFYLSCRLQLKRGLKYIITNNLMGIINDLGILNKQLQPTIGTP